MSLSHVRFRPVHRRVVINSSLMMLAVHSLFGLGGLALVVVVVDDVVVGVDKVIVVLIVLWYVYTVIISILDPALHKFLQFLDLIIILHLVRLYLHTKQFRPR